MAHNLATIDGAIAMAYQGETPWHELGTRLPAGVVSIADAMAAAKLDWDVELQRMYLANSMQVPRRHAVVRTTDSQVLGTVSDWYKVIQYREAFAVFQPAIDRFNLTIEAAGALGDGEKAWMLFRLPTTVSPVAGDDVNGYLAAITGHNGRTIFEGRPTPIRVVCQNTLDAAVGHGGVKGRVFGISHIGSDADITAQIEAATTLVVNAIDAMNQTGETFAAMARKRLTPNQVIGFIENVFPTPADGKVSKQLAARRKTVSELIWTGHGAEVAMSETAGDPNPWAVYNAVTEYFDHVATATSAKLTKRANTSALFGQGAETKLLALQYARELVAA